MQITEIRIKLMDDKESRNERLLAFCSITFDHMFVVRDLKIIDGVRGNFVAMPSRKLTDRCPECTSKNHLRARFCNQCGCRLGEDRVVRDEMGRTKLHADVAHPIHAQAREFVQGGIIQAYRDEVEKSKLPGYVCRYDDIDAGEVITGSYESYEQIPARPMEEPRKHAPHSPRSQPAPRQGTGSRTGVKEFGRAGYEE